MKNFENLPDKVLKKLIQTLHENFEEESINLKNDEETFMESTLDVIDSTLKYFGLGEGGLDTVDYSFFIQLCLLNNGDEDYIKKPVLESYEIEFEEYQRQLVKNTYIYNVKSYAPLTKQMVYSLEGSELIYYWEGDIIERDVEDSETTSVDIYNIRKKRKL